MSPSASARRRRRRHRGEGTADKGQTFQLPPCRVTPQRVKLILSTSQKDSPSPHHPCEPTSAILTCFDFFPGYFPPVTYWRFAIFIFNLTVRAQDFDSALPFWSPFVLKKENSNVMNRNSTFFQCSLCVFLPTDLYNCVSTIKTFVGGFVFLLLLLREFSVNV